MNVRLLVVYGILLELLVLVYLDGDSMWQRQHATSNTIGPNVGYERGHTVKIRNKGKKGDMGMREEEGRGKREEEGRRGERREEEGKREEEGRGSQKKRQAESER